MRFSSCPPRRSSIVRSMTKCSLDLLAVKCVSSHSTDHGTTPFFVAIPSEFRLKELGSKEWEGSGRKTERARGPLSESSGPLCSVTDHA